GSFISSDKPVAVFGSHRCANIPPGGVACAHLVEQLPPTVTWGKSFVTMPLATRLNGDTFRLLVSFESTNVLVNGAPVAMLNRGQFDELIITGPAQISADQPVLWPNTPTAARSMTSHLIPS
ncbi:MAG TPA: IgGFc-binding protein, partial [Gammaproteobacteria bacterium]|nr:IgGFc-binding protein [Gammaproteobacteria bacterium]